MQLISATNSPNSASSADNSFKSQLVAICGPNLFSATSALPGVGFGVVGAAMGINVTFPFVASYMYMNVRGVKRSSAYALPVLKLNAKLFIPQTIGKSAQYFASIGLVTGLNMAFPSMPLLNQAAGFSVVAVFVQQLLYNQVVDRTLTDVLKEKGKTPPFSLGQTTVSSLWKEGRRMEALSSLRRTPAIPGFLPAFLRECGALGMSFETGALINDWAKEKFGPSKLTAFGSGCVAGTFGALITQPLQVLALLQSGHVNKHGASTSYLKLFIAHMKQFGAAGFWNGLAMRIVFQATMAGNNIMFLNDDMQRYFRLVRGEEE
mmetsp:Transcript_11116/g.29177  ORF Transcript_11116/g.29177 Transcript_11116/m.29177 type:complete len:320 (+) Transcript_11116:113-1072(+)